MIDLKKIANSGGYGSGAKAIAERKAIDDLISSLPDPMLMATLFARTFSTGAHVASLGHCPDTDKDWCLEHESELGLVDGDKGTASSDAQSIAAVWNAYREGVLVVVEK